MPASIAFHYEFHGNRREPVILFLHGFMGSGADWGEVIQYFSADYCCLTIDLPGHGRTIYQGDISFEQTASALSELLNEQRIEKCFLVGYSMGGRLALFLALHYPQHFEKVVLESASPGLKTERERKERIHHDEKVAAELESGNLEDFLTRWYSQPIFEGLSEKNLAKLMEARRQNNPKMLSEALRFLGAGKQPSLWEMLPQNKVPLLLLVGEHDIKFESIANRMRELNDLVGIKTIGGCSHNIHLQQPEMYAACLRKFFGKEH